MSGAIPDDVTIGEVWRGMGDIRSEIAGISAELKALPATLAKELDDRSLQRVEAVKVEMTLRLQPMEARLGRLERIVWAVVAFVFAGVGSALLALILAHN